MNRISQKNSILSGVMALGLLVSNVSVAGFWGVTDVERAKQQETEKVEAQKKRVSGFMSALDEVFNFERSVRNRLGDDCRDIDGAALETNIFGAADATILRNKAQVVAQGQEPADQAALDLAFGGAHRSCMKSDARQTPTCFEKLSVLYGALAGKPIINLSLNLRKLPAEKALDETHRRAIAQLVGKKEISAQAKEDLGLALHLDYTLPELQEGDVLPQETHAKLAQLENMRAERAAKAAFYRSILGVQPEPMSVVKAPKVDFAQAAAEAGAAQ